MGHELRMGPSIGDAGENQLKTAGVHTILVMGLLHYEWLLFTPTNFGIYNSCRELSAILGYDVRPEKIEPHVQDKGGSNKVDEKRWHF